MSQSVRDLIQASARTVPPEWIDPPPPRAVAAPQVSSRDTFCTGVTQADVDAMWRAQKNQQILEFKVGLAWSNPGEPLRRTRDSQRCIDYYNDGVSLIQKAEGDIQAATVPELDLWGKWVEKAAADDSVASYFRAAGVAVPGNLPVCRIPSVRSDFADALWVLGDRLGFPITRASASYYDISHIGSTWSPSGTDRTARLRTLLTSGAVDFVEQGMGKGNNAGTRITHHIELIVDNGITARTRTSDSTGFEGPWYSSTLVTAAHLELLRAALTEDLPGVFKDALPTNQVTLEALTEIVRWTYPEEVAGIVRGLRDWGPSDAPRTRDMAPAPEGMDPILASIPYFTRRALLEKTRQAAINQHLATCYGMLRDYDAGKILVPLDDLNARAREALADVKRTDDADPGSYQYPVDAYAMKFLGRNSYAEAQYQAMRAQLVAAGGYYLPENALVDGPDMVFRREDVVLSVSEQSQADRAMDAIQARYAKIAKILIDWDYDAHPRLPTEQEWAEMGVPHPGTAVSDLLLNHALEQQALTKAAVDRANADARDAITRDFQYKMTALAVSTLAQVQAIEGSVSMDQVAYQQARTQALGEAQAQVDAAKGRFMAARGQALAAIEARARRLEKTAPPVSAGRLQAVMGCLDQASAATVPDDVYPPLARAAALLDLIQADIESAAADERRRYEDAQLLRGAREDLDKALVQAAEGFKAMTQDAAVAAQVAAEEARQAHIQAQRDTQAAAEALAALQAKIATYRTASSSPASAPATPTADLAAQIQAARAAVGVDNPSTLQVIALRNQAEDLEAQVPAAMAKIQAAYAAEVEAARLVNQARIDAEKASDHAALASIGGDTAKESAGLGGKEIGIGAALVAAKVLLIH